MIRFDLKLKNLSKCHLPNSDGYLLFSCISHLLPDKTSSNIHDNDGLTHITSLSGHFKSSDRRGMKKLVKDEEYRCSISLIGYDEQVENNVKKYLLIENPTLNIGDASMNIVECETKVRDLKYFMRVADDQDNERIDFSFEDPTIISQYKNGITEVFPRRDDLFLSILSKWNHVSSTEISLNRESILKNTFSEVNDYNYRTHNVVIKHDKKNNIKKHGFTGTCTYNISKASESISNAIRILSKFSEYSGVGMATSRGFGNVSVTLR